MKKCRQCLNPLEKGVCSCEKESECRLCKAESYTMHVCGPPPQLIDGLAKQVTKVESALDDLTHIASLHGDRWTELEERVKELELKNK